MNQSTLKTNPEDRTIEIELTQPQYLVHQVRAAITYLLWGRGAGKTVGGIAPWMARMIEAMPGHLGGIFGRTFEQLDKNIMPKIMSGLMALGYVQDEDYVVGKKPPADWPRCLYPIKKYERTITFFNGTTWQQIGMHEKGSANAFDFQSGIFDEAKFFDPAQLEDEVFPTFRGLDKQFGHLPEYLNRIFCTDKFADYLQVKWLLDKRKEMDIEKVNKIIGCEEKISELNEAYDNCKPSQRNQIRFAINKLTRVANSLRKNLTYVSEASALSNKENLGKAWWKDKKGMDKYTFEVAILNNDPDQAKAGFYHALIEKHFYKIPYSFYDYRQDLPLIIAMDYQHSIAPMMVAQLSQLQHQQKVTLNFINEIYTLYPHGISEAVDLFCEKYKNHPIKRVLYIFDQTAIGKRAGAEPMYKIVVAGLKKHKWNVVEIYMGDTPDHFDKYQKINAIFKGEYPTNVEFNGEAIVKCKISMNAASTRSVSGITKKDKEYENAGKYPSVDQSETTHFSDVVDQIIWAVVIMKLVSSYTSKAPIVIK